MRVTKYMVEKASEAYAEHRHPSRWDGEPWGEAGRRNHAAAIKAALQSVLKDLKLEDNTPPIVHEPPCHKCGNTKLRLVSNDGWYCKNCNDGPYLIDTTGLIKKEVSS